ncbi:LexA family transcriptional regulator [Vibrio europaeus]|uniref:LexA family transcriptional regulator n=1 Tax=Vibrio europaeus TaxID=300876 RepID=UPI00233E6198|nr:LexA family transcriptional regulator [Vibrio europaeus]
MELHEIIRAERAKRFSMEEVADTFKEWGIDCSQSTLSRVERGAIPSWPIVDGYCKLFGWSLSELERRLGRKEQVSEPDIKSRKFTETPGKDIPIVSWVSAGCWGDSPHIEDHNQETRFVTGRTPRNAFGLIVSGRSMENCEATYSFPDGSLIIVNPDKEPQINDFVIAVDEATQEATFKQLVEDCGKKKLAPLNPQYQVIDITETTMIKGVVFRNVIDQRI